MVCTGVSILPVEKENLLNNNLLNFIFGTEFTIKN